MSISLAPFLALNAKTRPTFPLLFSDNTTNTSVCGNSLDKFSQDSSANFRSCMILSISLRSSNASSFNSDSSACNKSTSCAGDPSNATWIGSARNANIDNNMQMTSNCLFMSNLRYFLNASGGGSRPLVLC
ncbi:MAG: hypothetical protein J6T06_04880 [Victivallales bacterium]|nr:hypothetical protein [Victivallales bacterium]